MDDTPAYVKAIWDDTMESWKSEPAPDRVISVTLNEREQELLTALFYNAATHESEVIQENDWDLMVALAKKLDVGDINQW